MSAGTLTAPELCLLEQLDAPDVRWLSATGLARRTRLSIVDVLDILFALRTRDLVTRSMSRGLPLWSITTLGTAALPHRAQEELG